MGNLRYAVVESMPASSIVERSAHLCGMSPSHYMIASLTILENLPAPNLKCDLTHDISELLCTDSVKLRESFLVDCPCVFSSSGVYPIREDLISALRLLIDNALEVRYVPDFCCVLGNGEMLPVHLALPLLFWLDTKTGEVHLRDVKCVYNIQRFVDTAVTIQNEDTYWELDGVGLIKRNKRKLDVWCAPSDVSAETKPKDPKYREHMCVDVVGLTGGATLAYNVKLPDVMSVYQKTYNKFVGIDLETGGLNNINLVGDTYIHGAARNLIFQAAVMVCDGKFVTEHLSEITVFHPQMEVQMEQEAVDLHKKTGLWDSLLVEYENASNYKELLVRIADSKCRSINIFVPFDESIDGELSDMFRVQSADIIERYILSTIPDLTYDRSLGLGCTMFGSSVHFDQDFVRHQMPTLNSRFQHRMVDVSALAIACNALSSVKPYFKKYNHRAMDDIVETYKELKYLMRFVG